MGISGLFDISARSLSIYQRALNVTSHNIANANNEDYSRQRVIFETERPDIRADGEWGAGVKIDEISRVRNQMTDTQIRSYNSKFSNNSTRSDILGQIETQFSEPSELGLSSLMNSFFNSWSKLAVTPNSEQLRTDVIQAAQKVTTKIQSVYEGINQIDSDMQNELQEKVQSMNTIVKELHSLNKQIMESKVSGQESNDLLDKRDKYIDELSKLGNINVNLDDNGAAVISIGGVFALDGYNYNEFKANYDSGGKAFITIKNDSTKLALNGGELYALTDMISNVVPGYKDKIDQMAQGLMTSVNDLHSTGSTLHDPPLTGINFFSSYASGRLEINSAIISDHKNIAISSNGQSGNSDIALKIAGLSDNKTINGKTIGEFYSEIVTGLGTEKQLNDQAAESNQLVLDQLQDTKESVSGVSLDEEMTNILRFQRSYDAAAKMVNIADEMLQTLLNMV